jgi:alkylation response protein AidB-like acyl-CoA dehydrogenase
MAEVVAPLNRVGDEQGSTLTADGSVRTPEGFANAYEQYVAAGWGGVPFEPEYGGGGFPWLVALALQELLASANMAFSLCPLLTQGAIEMLTYHGSDEQRMRYLPKMVSGEWTGTMNLTEPQAGSDVGALTTRAVRQDDGSYRLTGTKIFITYGDHDLAENIIHLVLARTPDAPPGTKGISCFIVPKFLIGEDGSIGERNDITSVSLEHKLGIHASPTCVLSYGDHGGAVGYLIGEENAGMRYMFTMMNNARLSVGLQGLALGERAYQLAVDYAVERRQGRAVGAPAGDPSPIVDHADVRRMLLTMRAYNEAMRCLLYYTAAMLDMGAHHPDVATRERHAERTALLIPISKAWCTDMGNVVTSIGIQVHGGAGYIEESGAPQHFRDARIAGIYEGTNGIQALDLVGRKLPMAGGAVVERLLSEMSGLDAALADAGDAMSGVRTQLADALGALGQATSWLVEHGAGEPVDAFAGASPYLELFGTVVGGWLLARSALAATDLLDSGDSTYSRPFLEAKIDVARFYCEQLLPRAAGLVPAVTAGAAPLFALSTEQLQS